MLAQVPVTSGLWLVGWEVLAWTPLLAGWGAVRAAVTLGRIGRFATPSDSTPPRHRHAVRCAAFALFVGSVLSYVGVLQLLPLLWPRIVPTW